MGSFRVIALLRFPANGRTLRGSRGFRGIEAALLFEKGESLRSLVPIGLAGCICGFFAWSFHAFPPVS